MVVEELEAKVRAEMPPAPGAGTRVRAAALRDGHEIEVVYRIDRKGGHVIDYFCDGARMARTTLLMLLCSEPACPDAVAVVQRWRAFTGAPGRQPARRVVPLRTVALIEEVPIDEAGHRCVARPASFECLTACPLGAHEPRVLRRTGCDLFEDGVWIAGGLRVDESSGAALPRFETPADARRWLAGQRTTALRVLQACRGARGGSDDGAG